MKRAGTEGSFTKAVLNLNLCHEISDRRNISLKAQAQKAGTNLDSSEEIYLAERTAYAPTRRAKPRATTAI